MIAAKFSISETQSLFDLTSLSTLLSFLLVVFWLLRSTRELAEEVFLSLSLRLDLFWRQICAGRVFEFHQIELIVLLSLIQLSRYVCCLVHHLKVWCVLRFVDSIAHISHESRVLYFLGSLLPP